MTRGPHGPTRHMTDADRARLAALIADGTHAADLCREQHASRPVVQRWIREAELEDVWREQVAIRCRSASLAPNGVVNVYTPLLKQCVAEGKTLEQIGALTGVTRERIRQVLEKYNCNAPRMAARRRARIEAGLARYDRTYRARVTADFARRAEAAGYEVTHELVTDAPIHMITRVDGYRIHVCKMITDRKVGKSVKPGTYYGTQTVHLDTDIYVFDMLPIKKRAAFWPEPGWHGGCTYYRALPYAGPRYADYGRRTKTRPDPRLVWNTEN